MPHITCKKALVIGADPKSRIFYTRMKGELEEAVKKLGFPSCFILQPPRHGNGCRTRHLESMREELTQLANTYLKAGEAIHDAIRESIRKADGFVNCSNNNEEKTDMKALVFDSKKGYSETYPIRAMRLDAKGNVEVYVGTFGTIYTDRYLRGKNGEEHWMPLKNSNILFYQTILSIAAAIDEYL